MERTRRSLFFLLTYLSLTGLILLFSPESAFKLFLSTGHYDNVFPRVMGLLLLGLAIIVGQLIRLRLEALYSTTLAVRALFLVGFAGFYLWTRDPFFLFVSGVIATGVALTGVSLWRDRR